MRNASTRAAKGGWALVLAMVVVTILAPPAPAARAQVAMEDAGAATATADAQALDPWADAERWWGAAGAIVCATEMRLIRVVPAIGMNPYALAAGLGGCLLAVMDIISTD
jgi:hypothetical protein